MGGKTGAAEAGIRRAMASAMGRKEARAAGLINNRGRVISTAAPRMTQQQRRAYGMRAARRARV